jgi:hypothetical protein
MSATSPGGNLTKGQPDQRQIRRMGTSCQWRSCTRHRPTGRHAPNNHDEPTVDPDKKVHTLKKVYADEKVHERENYPEGVRYQSPGLRACERTLGTGH